MVFQDDYSSCLDFGIIFTNISIGQVKDHTDFLLCNGYFFKGVKLCIPRTSLLDFFIWELHAGGLAGHFGRDKIIALVEDYFYWPSLKWDVARSVSQCRTYQLG